MRIQREANIHQQACDYMRLQYHDLLFRTDFAAGIKMTMGQAVKHKRLQAGRAWPDLFIAAPIGMYYGAFFELKEPGATVILKSGALSSDAHIQEQAAVLQQLKDLGYYAEFAIGFDDFKQQLDGYVKLML